MELTNLEKNKEGKEKRRRRAVKRRIAMNYKSQELVLGPLEPY
jgi:hypothetical protein